MTCDLVSGLFESINTFFLKISCVFLTFDEVSWNLWLSVPRWLFVSLSIYHCISSLSLLFFPSSLICASVSVSFILPSFLHLIPHLSLRFISSLLPSLFLVLLRPSSRSPLSSPSPPSSPSPSSPLSISPKQTLIGVRACALACVLACHTQYKCMYPYIKVRNYYLLHKQQSRRAIKTHWVYKPCKMRGAAST